MSKARDESNVVGATTTISQSTNSADRRKTLKKLGIGGALVSGAKWTSPVVVSVSLPAHAQTTGTTTTTLATTTTTTTTTTTVNSTSYWGLNVQAIGFGGIDPNENGIHACIVVTGDMADVTFQGGENIGRRNGTIPTDGTQGDAVKVASIPNCNVSTTKIEILSISPDAITLRVTSFSTQLSGFDVTINEGACGGFPALDGECGN